MRGCEEGKREERRTVEERSHDEDLLWKFSTEIRGEKRFVREKERVCR